MIDFRFHLVSIVSIFLALAVGIVLGAGPLQGSIGTQLTDQVSQLRQEKDQLRTQLDDANNTVKAQAQYAALVAPAALAGQLKDRSVALFVTPDVAGKFSQDVQMAVKQAGGTLTTIVMLKEDYRDPVRAPERTVAARRAALLVGLPPAADADALLGEILATALVHRSGEGDAPLASGATALGALKDAGLLDVARNEPERADLAVILSGPIAGTTASVTAQAATLLALAKAVSAHAAGLVVATGQPSTAVGQEETTSLVTALRKDGQVARTLSSVDHADSVMGTGVLVLTLARQERGSPGHFGISSDAQSVVPPAQ